MPSSPGADGRMPFREHGGDLLDQPPPHHLFRPPSDPLVQHLPRHGEHHVPRPDRAAGARRLLPVGERVAGEQGDLDGPCRALAPAALEPRVEPPGPAEQLERLEPRRRTRRASACGRGRARARETALPPARGRRGRFPLRRSGAWRGSESSSIHVTASRAKRPALYRVPGSTTSSPWCGDAGALLPGRLGGADVEPAVDLPGIGRDHLERQVRRERERHRGLPHRRRPHDHRDPSVAQSGAPAPLAATGRSWNGRARRAGGRSVAKRRSSSSRISRWSSRCPAFTAARQA